MILTADNAEQLLPTIVSRCETLRLRPLPVEAVEAYLKGCNADDSTARLLAHISGGRPGYALRLMQDKDALKSRARPVGRDANPAPFHPRERFAYAEKLTERKRKDAEAEESFPEYPAPVALVLAGCAPARLRFRVSAHQRGLQRGG